MRRVQESRNLQQHTTPYKVERPKTDAGIYGSSYIDWLNRAIRK